MFILTDSQAVSSLIYAPAPFYDPSYSGAFLGPVILQSAKSSVGPMA